MANTNFHKILADVGLTKHDDIHWFVDDPKVQFESVVATDGVHDVIVMDVSKHGANNLTVTGFNPTEDHLVFVGMKNSLLVASGDISQSRFEPIDGRHFPDDVVVLEGTPYSVDLLNNPYVIVSHTNQFFSGTLL